MCGIVGIVAKHQTGFNQRDVDSFQQMLYADAIRGWDATGVFGVTKQGNVDIKKQAAAAGHFISSSQYKDFADKIYRDYQMVIGHNRKATHGQKDDTSAHPFWDKDENICLIHNGMISNHKSFCQDSTVDSAAIANALGTNTIDEVISKIDGAFAFIWYNVEEKKLYAIRNQVRPLYILENNSSFIFASEDSMAYWVAKRNEQPIIKCQDLTPMTLYSISLADRKFVEERKIEKKVGTVHTPVTVVPFTNTLVEFAPDSFFYTTKDFLSFRIMDDFLTTDTRILATVDSYEVVGNGSVMKMTLTMLNVNNDNLIIHMYVGAGIFTQLDLTKAFEVTIMNKIVKDGKIELYTRFVEEHDYLTTQNNVQIAQCMWWDERFPLECDVCNGSTSWKDMEFCEVVIDRASIILCCPDCARRSNV